MLRNHLLECSVSDCTDTLTLYIQESATLALSGCADADQFEAALEAGYIWLPNMEFVKVLRALKSSTAA